MLLKIYKRFRLSAAVLFVAAVLASTLPVYSFAGEELFPVYPEIRNNVDFWKQIYSRYSLSQGVIHDKHDLGIVYEVVDLNLPESYRARKKNNRKIKRVKKNFQKILKKLAKNSKATNHEEQRVLDLFGENPSKKRLKEAAKNIRAQLGQKDRFKRGVVRSGAFLKRVRKIFREEGVPSDLAYLAHVESSFNVKAYSKFGAAGIWQFTRSTGKRYLKINYTVDERRDPIIASRAAARFLRDNYQKLESWPLAITAYNHGIGGMTRAQKKHGGYPNVFKNYKGRVFKFASKNFYSEFLAAMEVAKEYREYFGELHMDSPWPQRHVKMKGYADPAILTDHLGVDISVIRKYNPALRSPVFAGQKFIPKGYSLRLPSNSEELVELASSLPANTFSSKQKRSQFYRVRRGDTAGVIARIHGVTVNELVMANQLNRRATIYAGQNLRIPSLGKQTSWPANDLVVLSNLSKSQVVVAADIKQPDIVAVAMLESPNQIESPAATEQLVFPLSPPVVVAALEDVEAVSVVNDSKEVRLAMFDSPGDEAREFDEVYDVRKNLFSGIDDLIFTKPGNSILPPLLAENVSGNGGQALIDDGLLLIDINPQLVVGQLQVENVYSSKGSTYGVITVEAEETLGHYADWLGIPTWRIRRQNKLRYGKSIMVGQQINIPLNDDAQGLFEEKRYEFHKELIEDFFAAYRVDKLIKYTIQRGDNIWTLCRNEFDLPFWLVRQYNQSLNPSGLKPAQELLIPVVSRRQTDLASLPARKNVDS